MSDQQTQANTPIQPETIVMYGTSQFDGFVMDKCCSVKVSELFRTDPTTQTIHFKVVDDVLDLKCLEKVRRETDLEEFLPSAIFVRKSMDDTLERRLHKRRDQTPTVLLGSSGIGKSGFAFLAAIASASTGRHEAVLYARKVGDEKERGTSIFWMTRSTTQQETVDIVAARDINRQSSINTLCMAIAYVFFSRDLRKTQNPTAYGVKIIVDGPRYEEKTERVGGSDLVTSGGCPPQSQQNVDEWHFPIALWTLDELFLALKSLKRCNRCTVEEIFDTTGGSVRLALRCCSDDGKVDKGKLERYQLWMKRVAEAQGNDFVVKMAYLQTQLSAGSNSLDRLRSMIVKEPPVEADSVLFFESTLVLASAYVARLLWAHLSMSEVHKAMIYALSTGNRSLFGWHFELWGHKLSEVAIDRWRERAKAVGSASASAPVAGRAGVGGSGPAPSADVPVAGGVAVGALATGTNAMWPDYIQATGTGIEGVAALTAMWLYWKPSIPNFANIDAAILLGDGTLLCVQFTVSNEHGFDMRSFLHGFVFNIPKEVQKQIKSIKVIFVVPSEVEFSTIRVPLEQRVLFESHYVENQTEGSKPEIKFVKKKELKVTTIPTEVLVPSTGDEEDDMDDDDSAVVPYDESLDGEWSVDTSTMDMDSETTLKVEFETRAVALGSEPADVSFFALPDLYIT